MRSFEIYFGVKCFLCCVSSLYWQPINAKNIELKIFESEYVTSYRNKLREISNRCVEIVKKYLLLLFYMLAWKVF